ncbi:protein ACCELERATED CELL DEATH 6-like [Rhodamnia argentea]|uniref:Protein ACCELERATED CELL DEATH 6-like n=1 Tax=Rhodamnia argentea TaxID=178133 RepID=A0ABM3H4L1_9MYRT|nr:protein ACCELERATED CELL DEATH 6-like [Rhodamnia argentea]
MDVNPPIDGEMWQERRRRLEALLRTNPSEREQEPAQSDTDRSNRDQDPAQSDTDSAQSDTDSNTSEQDPAQSNKFMDPPLYFAAKGGDVDRFIRALEDYCAEEGVSLPIVLGLTSPSGNTLLHAAAESDDIVRAIIDFVPENLISAKNSRSETPLIIAARAGKTNVVELLLPRGNPRYSRRNNNSALHEAVRNRHCEVIRRLVSAEPKMLYWTNKQSKSPWCLAVETGNVEVLNCLLEAANDGEEERRLIEAQRVISGMSPVHLAIMYQKKAMLTEMWEKMPQLFELRDADHRLPLHFAAYTNYLDGVKFMIEKSPKSVLKRRLGNGYLPIHVACLMDHVRIVEELVLQWPDPAEFISSECENILHVSASYGSISTVKYILKDPKFGHLVNARDSDMNTPLHLAALNWQPSVLLLLARDRRVDLKLVNKKNMTALDVVEQHMKGRDAPLRKRLTQIILASAGTPRSGELAIWDPTRQSKGKELEPPELDRLKEEANTRMVVATLVAAMTFASGFSVPGGYNGSDPGAGIAILLHKAMYNVFVISNSIAMYSSIIALVILLWAQINDPHVVRKALLKARFPLLVALAAMPLAFMAGVYVTVNKLAWLGIVVLVMGSVALFIILSFYLLVYIPLGYTHPLVRRFTDLIIVVGISMSGSVTAGNGIAKRPAISSTIKAERPPPPLRARGALVIENINVAKQARKRSNELL